MWYVRAAALSTSSPELVGLTFFDKSVIILVSSVRKRINHRKEKAMGKKSGQPARTNQGTRAKSVMDPRKLEATLASAKIVAKGIGFHDPAFASKKSNSGK